LSGARRSLTLFKMIDDADGAAETRPKGTWGGARKGAGRPRKDGTRPKHPGVPHRSRAPFPEPLPVHVTWKITKEVWSLRTSRFFELWPSVMIAAERMDFRVVHYAFEKNRIHLIVEASSTEALGRGLQGLGIRIARAVNGLMSRSGQVLEDRYRATYLTDRAMAQQARRDLLAKATDDDGSVPESFVSRRPVSAPRTALLQQ
jgi:hypothetical protein